jgi:hypothetical protein
MIVPNIHNVDLEVEQDSAEEENEQEIGYKNKTNDRNKKVFHRTRTRYNNLIRNIRVPALYVWMFVRKTKTDS